jgi:hypothetical protein
VLNADDSLNFGLAIDFSTRSLHELALQTKFLIDAFYGKQPLYSYWNGCSTGGRQGLIEAQDHPTIMTASGPARRQSASTACPTPSSGRPWS